MCEYWMNSCGHVVKTPCKLPKLENQPLRRKLAMVPEESSTLTQYNQPRAQRRQSQSTQISPSRYCSGFPAEPRKSNEKCFPCLSHDEVANMHSMRPAVERLRIKREGAGNDNWGFSSQGMTGFGQGGDSSWMRQYPNQNGGYGTYLGAGRVMPDRRQPQQIMPQHNIAPGMRVMPPGGPQSWPHGAGGTLSNNPSSAGGLSNGSSAVGFGSSASAHHGNNVNSTGSDSSNGSGGNGSFINPWAVPKSELGHLAVPGGKLVYGNGSFMPPMPPRPEQGTYALPMQPPGNTRAPNSAAGGFSQRSGLQDRYRGV